MSNAGNPAYSHWKHLRARCNNPNNPDFRHYGGRGIKVSRRWNNFKNFLADMGPRPASGYTVERRDNEKGYSPRNCYWATRKDQGRNRRDVKLTYEEVRQIKFFLSKKIPQAAIARVYGISQQTVSAIQRGKCWA